MSNIQKFRLVAKDYRGNTIALPEGALYFNGPSYDEVCHFACGIALGLRVKYKKPRVEVWDADNNKLRSIKQY